MNVASVTSTVTIVLCKADRRRLDRLELLLERVLMKLDMEGEDVPGVCIRCNGAGFISSTSGDGPTLTTSVYSCPDCNPPKLDADSEALSTFIRAAGIESWPNADSETP